MVRPRKFDTQMALDQAVQVFWEHGFTSAGIQTLCDEMGMRPASLYGAFGDKRTLFIQALEIYTDRSLAGFTQATAGLEGAVALRAFFDRLVKRLGSADQGHWGCMVTNSAAEVARYDAEIASIIKRHWSRLETLLTGFLSQAQEHGELRSGAIADAAALLICTAQGLNVMAKTRPGDIRLQGVADAALAGLLIAPAQEAPVP